MIPTVIVHPLNPHLTACPFNWKPHIRSPPSSGGQLQSKQFTPTLLVCRIETACLILSSLISLESAFSTSVNSLLFCNQQMVAVSQLENVSGVGTVKGSCELPGMGIDVTTCVINIGGQSTNTQSTPLMKQCA